MPAGYEMGFRTFLAVMGTKTISINITGVQTDCPLGSFNQTLKYTINDITQFATGLKVTI